MKRKLIFIADNGGVINYKDDIIFKSILKPEDCQPMIRFASEETDGVPILCGLASGFIAQKDAIYKIKTAKRSTKPYSSQNTAALFPLQPATPFGLTL
jgi:hypothetical protein